ncbi:MAG: signal recognition particle-docking protein FtsY [Oscillospiraceae bacterium]|jgi:fused signal recognition particle receptor|nr:signal recognition particle-docking protein FtsY [Oscillospiraceae bacterium]
MEEKRSLFGKFFNKLGRSRQNVADKVDELVAVTKVIDDQFYEDLTDILVLADVGLALSEEIVASLRAMVKKERVTSAEEARKLLKKIIKGQIDIKRPILKWPMVMLVVGVNGVGKTTTIGKLAARFKAVNHSVMLCAADTFRAAAAEQLTIWAQRAGVPIVKHKEGADPAAVVFDGITSAKANDAELLIVDTAGRLHNKTQLMEELSKIRKIIGREYAEADIRTLLVLDATTGQNGLNQAKSFLEASEVNGIVLTKLDGTAKGGIIIAIQKALNLPVWYVGVGEGLDDLEPFDAEAFVDAIF